MYVSTCVQVGTCVCARVRLHACALEGIEDALPLGVLRPQERAPKLFVPLGDLRGGLGSFPGLSPFMLKFNN
jgi:hypothetical protein